MGLTRKQREIIEGGGHRVPELDEDTRRAREKNLRGQIEALGARKPGIGDPGWRHESAPLSRSASSQMVRWLIKRQPDFDLRGMAHDARRQAQGELFHIARGSPDDSDPRMKSVAGSAFKIEVDMAFPREKWPGINLKAVDWGDVWYWILHGGVPGV